MPSLVNKLPVRRNIVLPAMFAAFVAIITSSITTTLYFGWVSFAPGNAGQTLHFLVFVGAFLISAGHVLFLGVPAFWLLRRAGRLSQRSISLAGFIAGCTPYGFLSAPWIAPYGWDTFVLVLHMGALGLIAANGFWYAWRWRTEL